MLNINRRLIRLLGQLVTAINKVKVKVVEIKYHIKIIVELYLFLSSVSLYLFLLPIMVILIITKYRKRCSLHSSKAHTYETICHRINCLLSCHFIRFMESSIHFRWR